MAPACVDIGSGAHVAGETGWDDAAATRPPSGCDGLEPECGGDGAAESTSFEVRYDRVDGGMFGRMRLLVEVTGGTVLELAPGESTTIEAHIHKMPATEEFTATLRLWINMADRGGKFDIGMGVNRNTPCLSPLPAAVDFGQVAIGYPLARDLTVESCGKPAVTVSAIYLAKGSDEGLTLDFATGWFENDVAPSANTPAKIPPKLLLRAICAPTAAGQIKGVVRVDSNAPGPLEIPLTCEGMEPPCPHACIDLPPKSTVKLGKALKLSGGCSTSGNGSAITTWQWHVWRPDGNKATLAPSASAPTPSWTPKMLGEHKLQLVVTNSADVPSDHEGCDGAPASHTIVVVPDDELYVTVHWSAPGVPADVASEYSLNLHLANAQAAKAPGQTDLDKDGQPDPWYAICHDAFFLNPNPKWGKPADLADDPQWTKLKKGDPGESIGIPKPTAGEAYRVGVFAYNANKSIADVIPTVSVWVDDGLAWQGKGGALKWRDMWNVGAVQWPTDGGVAKFMPAKGVDGTPAISAAYMVPSPSMNPACD